MDGARRGRGWSGRPLRALAAGALLAAGSAAGGCAAPEQLARSVDEGYADVCRNIGEIVDRVDRVFGEPRVEDRERIVRARVGSRLELRENRRAALTMPLNLRAPLPALERRANIFLQFETVADTSGDLEQARASFGDNKNVSATILTRLAPRVDTGARLELFWDDGPQTGVRPFVRLERDLDPLHLFFEQQIYYLTDVRGGAKGLLGADRVFRDASFVRLTTSLEGNRGTPGAILEHALGYRRRLPIADAALAAEIGTTYVTYDGDPEARSPGRENDPDEAYARVRVIGRVIRPWIEYEIAPAVNFPWHHHDKVEFSAAITLRAVFERNLSGPGAR